MDLRTTLQKIQRGDLNSFCTILSTQDSPINEVDENGWTLIHHSIDLQEHEILQALLDDERTNLEARTPKGLTILHLATNNLASTKAVLAKSPHLINSPNNWHETPLHLAAANQQTLIVELLLSAGADQKARDKWNRTPAMVVREYATAGHPLLELLTTEEASEVVTHGQSGLHSQQLVQDFMKAAQERKPIDVDNVKVKHMIDFSKPTAGAATHAAPVPSQALSKKVEFPGDINLCRTLLADPSTDAAGKDMFGLTALHKFASWGNVELIELILEHLTPAQANVQSTEGFTALHWAVDMCADAAVEALLKNPKIDATIKDKNNKTARQIITEESIEALFNTHQK